MPARSTVDGDGDRDGGRAAVFLDRDGTLIDELGYLGDPAGVRLYPTAAAAVRRLNEADVPAVLVTNQSGLARGLFDENDLARVHARLAELLAEEGARLDLVLWAGHHPGFPHPTYDRQASWRKPQPGMLHEAARRLGLDLASSAVVGDTDRDLAAGSAAGLTRLYLVATGKGVDTLATATRDTLCTWRCVPDVAAAVDDFLAAPAD